MVCLGLVTVILVKRCSNVTPVEVLQAVPEDAILFIEDLDYEYLSETFLSGSRIWIDFIHTAGRSKLDSTVHMILSQVNSSESLKDLLLKKGLHLSLHLLGKDQLSPLFYVHFEGMHSDHEFEQLMLGLLEERSMVNERKYEAIMLYDVSGKPGFFPGKFSFSCLNGLCLISPSSMLVEEAIRTIHSEGDLSLDEGMELVRGTAGRYVHANIYLNYDQLQQLFYPYMNQENWNRLDLLPTLASWGELDLDIKEDAIILNGMTFAEPDEQLLLDLFTDQSPVRMEIHQIMPSGISYFLHMGISDPTTFRERINDYFGGLGILAEVEAENRRVEEVYGIDPLEDLTNLLDDEMAWFAIEGETGKKEDEVLIVETKSRSESAEVVMRWIEKYLQVNAFDMRSLRHVYQLDNQTSFNIYHLPDLFYKEILPGQLFSSYFTLYENYLIFGPSVEVLSRVIYQNVLHKTFVSDPVFKEMSDYLSNRSNITLFLLPFAYMDYKRDFLNTRVEQMLDPLELFLRRIPGVVVQYSTEDQLSYQSISAKYNSQIKEKAMTVWESLLDTVAVIKPALVINHNTSEKEIFIQDAANRIYLINSTGRILWKQRLEGPILGDMYQVDFYKNGKLQYLFNTTEKIHLIDRNGNYVERYPVSLRSDATNPLALFDYTKNKDYRLFVAGEDRKIYVYDIEGNIVTGWRFDKTESRVTKPIQHFRINDRDYITFSDNNRTYFMDRRGRERIKLKERVVLSTHNSLTLDMNIREERPRWISTNTSGDVIAIYRDGTVSTLLKQEVSEDHFFMMQDMDMDGISEFVFTDGNELNVLDQEGKRVYSYRVREKINQVPDIYKFSASDIKIGITDQARNRIYLVNSDGSLYEGFPLEGSTRFSIGYFAGSDSRFNLIVGSANNFLYNYSIE